MFVFQFSVVKYTVYWILYFVQVFGAYMGIYPYPTKCFEPTEGSLLRTQ
jgi:hypothetical protein